MSNLEILLAVRNLLGQAERWTKGALARGEDDRKVSLQHPHACKFSLEGAFLRVQYITRSDCRVAHALLRRVIDPHQVISMEAFNNALGTTHWTIIQKLDKAIRLLGGTPPVQVEEE
jgi:hypothetical protein